MFLLCVILLLCRLRCGGGAGERGYTVSKFHRMINESINLDEPILDIDVLVNSMTNAGKNWELDIDSSNRTSFGFISSSLLLSLHYPYYMNDLCKTGNRMTDQY